jgi:N-acetylglutamate synthase-like GNAT family acetyltransferase
MDTQPFTLREPTDDDLDWVVRRHGEIYSDEYGWDSRFRDLVAEITTKFSQEFDPVCERGWIAEREGERVGCVFLVRKSDLIAQLRLLLVEPSARGLGLGRTLVNECIEFAAFCEYEKIQLWTNDVLVSARKIYEAAGFRLIDEEHHDSWGRPLTSQTWELDLVPSAS